MGKKKSSRLTAATIWSSQQPTTLTARNNLDIILESVRQLSLSYWRKNFFFFGARDEDLLEMTGCRFPVKLVKGKTHPVISLKPLPGRAGFKVCPCSSKKPFRSKIYRYVNKGCRLLHTGFTMDRHAYLVERVHFNIPSSIAETLKFRGEVPAKCLKKATPKPAPGKNANLRLVKT